MTEAAQQFVATADIRAAMKGRETNLLDALGILWRSARLHINCPFPDHPDRNPSWRFDEANECLVRFGRRWHDEVIAGLRALGLEPPTGFAPP
jgi:hypothetical protein